MTCWCWSSTQLAWSAFGLIDTTSNNRLHLRHFTQAKTPPAAVLLKKAAKLDKGSGEPNKVKVGKVTENDLRNIAETKMEDLNANTIEAAVEMIRGTARSMGLEVL